MKTLPRPKVKALIEALGGRSIVFVGLMGAGKTVIGKQVAAMLSLPFVDSDHEIEAVSRMTVPEIFEAYGEQEFRALEQRVILRVLDNGPQILSTGGGAFINDSTRAAILSQSVSVWLKAELDLLMERVSRRQNRPLLKVADPRAVMADLMAKRYPVYEKADITIHSRDVQKDVICGDVIEEVLRHVTRTKGETA